MPRASTLADVCELEKAGVKWRRRAVQLQCENSSSSDAEETPADSCAVQCFLTKIIRDLAIETV
jgi:hypothetical protein